MQTPNEPFSQSPIPEPTGSVNNINYGGGAFTPGQPNGVLILILGILGVTVCGICAPVAWVMGNTAIKEIDSGKGDPSQRGNANIGRIIGMVGSALIVLGIIFYVVFFAAFMSRARNRPTTNYPTSITIPPQR